MAIDLRRVTFFNSDFPSDSEADDVGDVGADEGDATSDVSDAGNEITAGDHYSSDALGSSPGSVDGSSPYDNLTSSQQDDLRAIENAPTADLPEGQSSSTDYRVFIDGDGDVNAVGNPVVDENGEPVQSDGLPEYQMPGASVRPDGGENTPSPPTGPMLTWTSGAGEHSGAGNAGSRNPVASKPTSSLPNPLGDGDKPRPTTPGEITPEPPPPTLRERLAGYVRSAWEELCDRVLPAIGPEEAAATGGLKFLSSAALALKLRLFVRSPSRVLGQALEAAGFIRKPGDAAHHLVAHGAKLAEKAREILQKYGIDINEAANGVFLPKGVHDHLHTNAYYAAVNEALRMVSSREEALMALENIRQQLLAGHFP